KQASRVRLLQLMADKFYFRVKCDEVYVSPCCSAKNPILVRDSSTMKRVITLLKGCNGCVHYTKKKE
ncbi:hypothetical protein CLU79DRAFT_701990, partial [Phycomyces nitens]